MPTPAQKGHTRDSGKQRRLSEVLDIRLGGVTGDSSYFVITESQRKELKLPISSVTPIVSRSRHIMNSAITERHWAKLCDADEKVWLFRPSKRSLYCKSVKAYLRRSHKTGGCQRDGYKIQLRDPWYLTPLPARVDAFLTGMSGTGVWMCMNESHTLSSTNTLYVATFRENTPKYERYAWALSMLTSGIAKQIERLACVCRRVSKNGAGTR